MLARLEAGMSSVGTKGLVNAVVSAPIPDGWNKAGKSEAVEAEAGLAGTVAASLGSSVAARAGTGILQGTVNQGVSFGSPLAGQGTALDVLRERSGSQFDPAQARKKRREQWAEWIEIKAEAIRRIRERMPKSSEIRDEARAMLAGFEEVRNLVRARRSELGPQSAKIRKKVRDKLAYIEQALEKAAERKLGVSEQLTLIQQDKSEVARQNEAVVARRKNVEHLRMWAVRAEAAARHHAEKGVALEKSSERRRILEPGRGSSLLRDRGSDAERTLAGSKPGSDVTERSLVTPTEDFDTATAREFENVTPGPEAMSMRAQPKAHPWLAEEGGLKSLFEEASVRKAAVVDDVVETRRQNSHLSSREGSSRESDLPMPTTSGLEPTAIDAPIDIRREPPGPELSTVVGSGHLQSSDAPESPRFAAREYDEEVDASSRIDSRELRDDPVRLTSREVNREQMEPTGPEAEPSSTYEGVEAII